MAAPAELCCLERFPPHLGPLDVLLSASRFPSLFPDDNDPPTVFFRPQRPHGSAIPTILLRVHPTTAAEDGTTAKSRSRVCLYTSRLFMRFHRLGVLGTTGTVRAAEPVKLARVVLGARSRQSLRWATAGPFISLLHDLCRRRQPLLARQGEPLLLPLPAEEPEQVGAAGSRMAQGRVPPHVQRSAPTANDSKYHQRDLESALTTGTAGKKTRNTK